MIDGAVSAAHPALRNARIEQRDFARATGPRPTEHGTAVASLLVGDDRPAFRGAAPGGRLFSASVVSSESDGASLAVADSMVRALDWLVASGAPVVNISLAGPPNLLLEDAVKRAAARGVIIVAAVGNDGPAAPPRYPAAYDGVLGVTAVDSAGGIYRRAARGGHVDLAAPGVNVIAASQAGRYGPKTGTSFAAPQVAAALARDYRRAEPVASQRVIAALTAGARDSGERGKDPVFGSGIIGAEGGK
jgi:subtilisin family serine protease